MFGAYQPSAFKSQQEEREEAKEGQGREQNQGRKETLGEGCQGKKGQEAEEGTYGYHSLIRLP
jgi:hypothetical protein